MPIPEREWAFLLSVISTECLEEVFAQLRAAGIESYCQQICGGGYCGTGPVCQYGIDAETEMPVGFYPPSEGQDVRPDRPLTMQA